MTTDYENAYGSALYGGSLGVTLQPAKESGAAAEGPLLAVPTSLRVHFRLRRGRHPVTCGGVRPRWVGSSANFIQ